MLLNAMYSPAFKIVESEVQGWGVDFRDVNWCKMLLNSINYIPRADYLFPLIVYRTSVDQASQPSVNSCNNSRPQWRHDNCKQVQADNIRSDHSVCNILIYMLVINSCICSNIMSHEATHFPVAFSIDYRNNSQLRRHNRSPCWWRKWWNLQHCIFL